MAYFSNATEGEIYRQRYCDQCIHDADEDCPIFALHIMWNHEQRGDETKQTALDILIPRSSDGDNEQCKLFARDEEAILSASEIVL